MPRVTSLFVAGVAASAAAAAAAFVYLKKPISCPSQLWSCLPFSTTSSLFCEASKAVPALSPAEFRGFKVLSNEAISPNTHRIRLSLPEEATTLGLVLTSCVVTKCPDPSDPTKHVTRPYTPITTELESQKFKYVEFVVKKYPGGKASTYLAQVQAGDVVQLKGPFEKLDFFHQKDQEKLKDKKYIGMIAGGTGITPMLQLLNGLLKSTTPLAQKYADVKFTLLFANQTPQDILCKNELDLMGRLFPDRFQVHYIVDDANKVTPQELEKGNVQVGRINKEMIQDKLHHGESSMVLLCGPESLIHHFAGPKNPDKSQGPLTGVLHDLGYSAEQVYKF